MMNALAASAVAAAVAIGWSLPAGTVADPKHRAAAWTLSAAVESALATHPSVASARARAEEAAAEYREARGAWWPSLRASGSAIRYEEPFPVTPIHGFSAADVPDFDDFLVQGQINASWTLFDMGARRAGVHGARARADAATSARSAAEHSLAARTVAAYVAVLAGRDVLAAEDRRLSALASERDRVRRLRDADRAAAVDVLRAEAALAAAQAGRVRAAADLDVAERDLARWAGVPLEAARAGRLAPLPENPPRGPAGLPPLAPRDSLFAAALAASPLVEQARGTVRAAEAARTTARSALFPELKAVGNVTDWGSSGGDFAAEWQAGLRVDVLLLDGGGAFARVERAGAALRAAREDLRSAETHAQDEADRAAAALETALARYESLAAAAARYEEVARIEALRLENGAGTQIEWIAAEADLLGARAALAQGRGAVTLGWTALARALGRLDATWVRANLEVGP